MPKCVVFFANVVVFQVFLTTVWRAKGRKSTKKKKKNLKKFKLKNGWSESDSSNFAKLFGVITKNLLKYLYWPQITVNAESKVAIFFFYECSQVSLTIWSSFLTLNFASLFRVVLRFFVLNGVYIFIFALSELFVFLKIGSETNTHWKQTLKGSQLCWTWKLWPSWHNTWTDQVKKSLSVPGKPNRSCGSIVLLFKTWRQRQISVDLFESVKVWQMLLPFVSRPTCL